MKKIAVLLIGVIGVISLTACQRADKNENPIKNSNKDLSGGTTIEMALDENYDVSDPFVNARLFCASEDIDVLNSEISFEMDGESAILEIKDNKTEETLWSNTWQKSIDKDTIAVSLNNIQKEKEYAIWFTGTKIKHAVIKVTFKSAFVQEREKPSK